MFHYEKKPMFETDQTSRENVKMDFRAQGRRLVCVIVQAGIANNDLYPFRQTVFSNIRDYFDR